MKIAHDIYAETNPAFCASALVHFTRAYVTVRPEGPELPIAYLTLPVVLSGELAPTFNGTNKNTGLLAWLERNPALRLDLSGRINASLDIVTEAVQFGCFANILVLGDGARLGVGTKALKESAIKDLSDEPAQAIKHAGRMGHWFAAAGSTRTVFDMMGLTV